MVPESTPQTSTQPLDRASFQVLAKPVGATCNLDCAYCYFLSKAALYPNSDQRMTGATLEGYLRNLLQSSPDGPVEIAWQGGEPTMRGLAFFRRAVELAEQFKRPGQSLTYTIQTNGTLLDDEWGDFLDENKFLVGVSIDGPADLHNEYRVNRAGRGTYDQVLAGWRTLQRHGVEANVLCTVNRANQAHPLAVYRHFRDVLEARHLQFIPVVERVDAGRQGLPYRQTGNQVTSRSCTPQTWGAFLCSVFDEWVSQDVGSVFVQHFDMMLGNHFGQFSLCSHSPECGAALVVEHNGDIYSCDHYVEPDYLIGNVATRSLQESVQSAEQRQFGRQKWASLPNQCLQCDVRWACQGGCPKDRFAVTSAGEPGLNYLCPGYLEFFRHAAPSITRMGELLAQQRPAAEIMHETSLMPSNTLDG